MSKTSTWLVAVALLTVPLASFAQAGSAGSPPVERGRYLVQGIAACGNCHTPQGPQGPLPGKEMAGGTPFEEAVFTAYASNLTPDPATGVGRWTDAQLVKAIREGIRPDGSVIGPPMPIGLYRGLSDNDVTAIVAYLRTLPPVANAVPKSRYGIALPPSYGPPVGAVPDISPSERVAYGAYLAGPLGHCIECHSTPGTDGAPDLKNRLGGGGMVFKGPWGRSVAGNITRSALAGLTDAQLKTIITRGLRPSGIRLRPPMPVDHYARMSTDDLDALVAYLRSLPPK